MFYYDSMMYVIKVTDDCFLRCDYCMTDQEFKPTEFTIDQLKDLLYKTRGFAHIDIGFVGGEPLMVGKDWFREAWEHIKWYEKHWHTKFSLHTFTNGHMLDDEWIELFKEMNLGIILSYDGAGHGPKGKKRGQKQVQKYGKHCDMVNVVVNDSNYKDLVNVFKEVESSGCKRMMNFYDIYATKEKLLEYGDGVIELFDYIRNNKTSLKLLGYHDLKRFAKASNASKTQIGQMGKVVLNSDYTLQPDGSIRGGLPQAGEDFVFGKLQDINHINELLHCEKTIQFNKDYIQTLDYIGEFREVNLLTRGGGFFWDKCGQMPMNAPNLKMLPLYQKLIDNVKKYS